MLLRKIFFLLSIILFTSNNFAQTTFPWNGTYGGAGVNRTYTTTVSGVTMSATIVNSENVWQDGSPVWFPSGSTVPGGGCSGITATNEGMLLSTDWTTNTTKTITTTITFSTPVVGPVNFKLYDINDDGFGSWDDRIIVSGTNASAGAVNIFKVGTPCVQAGGGTVTGNGTPTLTFNSGLSTSCTCWGNNEVNVGVGTDCIKTITIQYKSNVSPTSYNNPKQYVVISNLTAFLPTAATAPTSISGTANICSGQSTTLTAVGGNATTQWYTGSCGGTLVGTGSSITVSPISNTTYFAANQGSCNTLSSCVSLLVNVASPPTAGTDGSTTICESSGSIIDLFGLITGEQVGGTWTRLTGTGGTFNALAGTFTPALGTTTSTFQYSVNGTAPCLSDISNVTITINTAPNAGTNGTLTICSGTTVTAAQLFAQLGGTPDAGGTWSPALVGAGTYTYSVTIPGCGTATASVVVSTQATPNAGTNGTLTICSGTTVTAAQLFAQLGGTPGAGGTWSPALAGAGTYTYTVSATAPCTVPATANVVVSAQAAPNAGTNGTLTICSGTTVTAAQLFAQLGGTPDAGGTWSPALAGAGMYTYTVSATAPCTVPATANVVVTAQAAPNAGTNGTLTICSGTTITAAQLFAQLGGTPDAGGTWSPALVGAGTYTYSVTIPGCGTATASVVVSTQATPNAGTNGTLTICSGTTVTAAQLFAQLGGTPSAGGTWSPALAGAGTYTYTVSATAPCTVPATANVVVSAQAAPNAGTNGTLTICSGTTVTAAQLFAQLGGTPDAGGTWSPALAGAGMYTYTVSATAPCTVSATANVVVSAQTAPNSGTNGTLTICSGTTVTAAQLFAQLGGTPDAGGTWSPALAGAGTYSYTVSATAPCTVPATANVVVSAQTAPNAGTNGTLTICSGTTVTAAQLFAQLGGTPDAGGTWSPALAGAGTYTYTVSATAPCTVPATANVVVSAQAAPNAGTNGTLTICSGTTVTAAQLFAQLGGTPDAGGTWSPALAGAGMYTYTVSATSPCLTSDLATIVVSEQVLPMDPVINITAQPTCLIPTGTIEITSPIGTNFLYSVDGVNYQISPIFSGLVPGNYSFTVQESPLGCLSGNTMSIIDALPIAPAAPNAGVDTTYCSTDIFSSMIANGSGGNYSWYSDATLSNIIGTGPSLIPENTQGLVQYFVTETVNDCESEAAIVIITIIACDTLSDSPIIIPTAFTPNSDSDNDNWQIIGLDEKYPDNVVYIYNRWGNLLFESKKGDYDGNKWDGTFNGKALPVASYYYIIFTEGDSSGEVLNGIVSIIKAEK